jgi:hypothetical protein
MERDTTFLNQLMTSLEEAEKKLEKSYHEKNVEMFSKSKQMILAIQDKIREAIDGI